MYFGDNLKYLVAQGSNLYDLCFELRRDWTLPCCFQRVLKIQKNTCETLLKIIVFYETAFISITFCTFCLMFRKRVGEIWRRDVVIEYTLNVVLTKFQVDRIKIGRILHNLLRIVTCICILVITSNIFLPRVQIYMISALNYDAIRRFPAVFSAF